MRGQAALKIVDPMLSMQHRMPAVAAPLARSGGCEARQSRPAWLFRGLFVLNLSMWLSILLAIRALI